MGRSGPRPLGTAPAKDVAPLTEQLRLRLEQKPRAPRPDRNPFTFGGRRTTSATRSAAAAPDGRRRRPETRPEPPRPGAEFRLAGMASTQGADGPVWTAMIHDGRSLLYASNGRCPARGFAVIDIQGPSSPFETPPAASAPCASAELAARRACARPSIGVGKLTELRIVPSFRKSRSVEIVSTPTSSWPSRVDAAICGLATTCGSFWRLVLRRLGFVDVERGTADVARLNRRHERAFVDQVAARGVDDPDPFLAPPADRR